MQNKTTRVIWLDFRGVSSACLHLAWSRVQLRFCFTTPECQGYSPLNLTTCSENQWLEVGRWNFLLKMASFGGTFVHLFFWGGAGQSTPNWALPMGHLRTSSARLLQLPSNKQWRGSLWISINESCCHTILLMVQNFRLTSWYGRINIQFSPWDQYMISLHPDC